MDRFDPFVKYADVYGDIINWEKDPMNKPQNQNKYFFSDGKTYYEQICKMLRLMSVFKEAFNQIYSNEDEISEAWENFVNNLSASVVEGSEPDVTLTWTDDSVNFEFTMVPGVPGEQGVGITSISFNSDYTMTITLSDGNSYTSMSLKGETGPQGPQGETGSGLQILDVYASLADLQSAHPTGQPGDAYQVGSGGSYTLYIWSSSQSAWVQAGTLGTVSPYTSAPLMDGTASAGSQNLYARGDHVHPSDTSRASKEELDALIRTSQALIDQSFTYRESPAIQDGLARIDKIKGNTLIWNQLVNYTRATQTVNGVTFTNNEDGSCSFAGVTTAMTLYQMTEANVPIIQGHKYLFKGANGGNSNCRLDIRTSTDAVLNESLNIGTDIIFTATQTANCKCMIRVANGTTISNAIKFIPQLCDLTKMFGAGNEPATVEEFALLFPLSYYGYNAGSLLSFNGSGIKTTGKNLVFKILSSANLGDNGTIVVDNQNMYDLAVAEVVEGKQYHIGNNRGDSALIGWFTSEPQIGSTTYDGQRIVGSSLIPIAPITGYIVFRIDKPFAKPTFNLGTGNIDYEPYTSSALDILTSTYFPTGMKSAGAVYDELTPNKAITRVRSIDLGVLTWAIASNGFYADVPNSIADCKNAICSKYEFNPSANDTTGSAMYNKLSDKQFAWYQNQTRVYIKDTSYSDVSTFKTAMSGVYLYYELATPVETAVDLDLDFISYQDGTEQLLPVNGSAPTTSPIIADMTYMSIDDAMEYIIEKLANVPLNTQQILDSLEDDVADLQTDVSALQPAVSALQTSVGNINTNIGQLSSTVAGHTASISDIQSDITDLNAGLSNIEDTVTDNTSRIGTLESGLSTTNGNVQSLSSQVQSINGRVTNLETDLLIVVKKEYDYDSVAGNTDFGVQTPLSQEPGYKIIGIVGSEVQQGEYTSAEPWIIVTQAHVHYTSTGGVVLSMMARNVSEYTKTNVRVYLYLLCIKDTQSE